MYLHLLPANSGSQLRHLIEHGLARCAARTAPLLHTRVKVPHCAHIVLKQWMQLFQLWQ